MNMPPLIDLYRLSEDERIDMIGKIAMSGKIIGVMVDGDKVDPGKADRYVSKVRAKFPNVREVERFAGPVKNVTTIKFGPVDG